MRARRMLAGAAAASLVCLAVPLASPASAAPITASQTNKCQTDQFAPFDWATTATATAVTDGNETVLDIQTNELPGVVPLALTDADVVGTVVVSVNGQDVTLTGSGKTSAAARSPLPMPKVSARFAGAASPLTIVVKRIQFDVSALGANLPTLCPPGGVDMAWSLGALTVDGAAGPLPTVAPVPTPVAAPTPKPTPKPTATPSKKPKPTKDPGPGKDPEDSSSKGSPATGKVTYACLLQPFASDFDYTPTVRLAGSRAKAGDQKVSLAASMSEIPGLAPVPIENGTMNVTMNAKMGGTSVALKGRSTVNAAPYGTVPVPTLTAQMSSSADEADVEVTGFSFAFGEMSGVAISAECTVKGGGALGAASFGVGDLPESDPGTAPGGGSPGGGTPSGGTPGTSTLPQTGSGAPLAMLGLWSSALVLAGVALFLHLPRRRQEA